MSESKRHQLSVDEFYASTTYGRLNIDADLDGGIDDRGYVVHADSFLLTNDNIPVLIAKLQEIQAWNNSSIKQRAFDWMTDFERCAGHFVYSGTQAENLIAAFSERSGLDASPEQVQEWVREYCEAKPRER